MTVGLHIKSWRLKKAVCFEDVTFTVTPGLSTIYGLNRTNARTSGNGNGAGKSAFFSQLGEILYESPIVGEKQDAVKGGSRLLKMSINGKPISINRIGNKLDIKIDGKSGFRTKPMAKAWLAKNLSISEEEFNTYVHLDARIPHPLVMGSSTERRKFFTSFFGLDKLDIERKLFTAELAKLGKIRAGYSEVLKEYREVKSKAIKSETLVTMKSEVNKFATELTDLNEKNIRLQNISQLLNFEVTAGPQLKILNELCPNIDIESFEELLVAAKRNLKEDKEGLEDALAWSQYQRDSEHYTKAYDALSINAKKLITKLGIGKARARCLEKDKESRSLTNGLHSLQSELKMAKLVADEDLSKTHSFKKRPPEDANEGELIADKKALEHLQHHARKFKTGTCDTCGQSVKARDPEVLSKKISDIDDILEDIDNANAYKKARVEQKHAEANAEALRHQIASMEVIIIANKRYVEICDKLTNLPDRPPKFEGRKLEVAVKQRMVDEDKERLQLLNFLHPNLDTIFALNKLTDKQRSAGSMAERLQARINMVHERLSKLRANLEVNKLVQSNVQRLRLRCKEMRNELANEEPLRLLVEGYSDKAMKRMAVQAISSRLMTEVNKYAKFVFSEDYSFDFKWDTSQLSLIVNRKYGKKLLTSDVRKLSGAESKLFTIVMVLALLTFVPARKRSNILILDEPTSNFSTETTDRFKALLPVLLKVIPSIIVITPRKEERYTNAMEWTMVKDGGNTRLVAGHPSTIRKGLK